MDGIMILEVLMDMESGQSGATAKKTKTQILREMKELVHGFLTQIPAMLDQTVLGVLRTQILVTVLKLSILMILTRPQFIDAQKLKIRLKSLKKLRLKEMTLVDQSGMKAIAIMRKSVLGAKVSMELLQATAHQLIILWIS